VPSTPGGGGLVTGNVTYQAVDGSYKTLTPSEIASMDGRYNGSDKTCLKPGVTCYAPQTDAAAVQLFQQYPIANAPGGDFYNTGSFNFTSPAPVNQITNIARIDYNISPRQTLFVRGNLQSDNQQTSLQFPGLPPAASIYGNNKGIAAGHTWSINDHLTNNARYGFTRTGNATRGSGSQPYTNFLAFDTLTATTTSTIYQVATNDFSDDLTYTKGRHTFQGGVDVRLVSNGEYFDRPEVPVSVKRSPPLEPATTTLPSSLTWAPLKSPPPAPSFRSRAIRSYPLPKAFFPPTLSRTSSRSITSRISGRPRRNLPSPSAFATFT
jgi:hypothetical protein